MQRGEMESEGMNQHRFVRLIKLMQLLEERPRHLNTITRYLNVSERTTYRYLECFREIGYEVTKEKDLRFTIKKN
jgi:DNA-binding IclR family transcriptional regulator